MFPADTKILVVDDMLTMRKLVIRCLKDLGYSNITDADDGETAWPILETAAKGGIPFQLVISDWNMPKLPGIELLKKVRGSDVTKGVPFVFITAEAEMQQVMEAIKSGASNYIAKPFTLAQLRQVLKNAVEAFGLGGALQMDSTPGHGTRFTGGFDGHMHHRTIKNTRRTSPQHVGHPFSAVALLRGRQNQGALRTERDDLALEMLQTACTKHHALGLAHIDKIFHAPTFCPQARVITRMMAA